MFKANALCHLITKKNKFFQIFHTSHPQNNKSLNFGNELQAVRMKWTFSHCTATLLPLQHKHHENVAHHQNEGK